MTSDFTNTLYTNDNLYVLSGLNSGLVDLIYLDPPFNSKRTYSAPVGSKAAGASFKDIWTWEDVNEYYLDTLVTRHSPLVRYITNVGEIHSKAMMAYLTYMAQRLIEMHRILKDTGSIYLHCNEAASHYLKIVLDAIFGKNNFVNNIIWKYGLGGSSNTRFARKHDDILFYRKSERHFYFNVQYEPSTSLMMAGKEKKMLDVWDIPTINNMAKERTGYPTQKPLALLDRIIKASSNEGDIVLDPFCGCATTCVAAQQLGRRWIGIDIEKQSVSILIERLSDASGIFKDFAATDQIPKRTDLMEEPPSEIETRKRMMKNKIFFGV